MPFHTRKTFVNLRNTNWDIFVEIRWLREAYIGSNDISSLKIHKGTKNIFKSVHVSTVVQY